jgi:hypothetical protein
MNRLLLMGLPCGFAGARMDDPPLRTHAATHPPARPTASRPVTPPHH